MSEHLLIRLQADGRLAWLSQDAGGRVLSASRAGAPSAEQIAQARRICVIVPAESVVLLEMPHLAGNAAQVHRAVPYALEDQLASPVEELHFAIPERAAAPQTPVAVVSRSVLAGWIGRLAEEGVRADAMYVDARLLACAAAAGCVLLEGGRALWRFGVTHAGACEIGALPEWMDLAAQAHSETGLPPFEVFDFRNAAPLELPFAAHHYHANRRDPLALLADGVAQDPGPNLLQGEFAPTHRQAPALRLWRRAAVLAAAALALAFVYYGVDCWRLSRQSARLDTAARGVLHTAFPGMDKVRGDPRQLMQSALGAAQGGAEANGLLPLLGRIAPILGSTTRTTLTGLEYHNATLELALNAPDVQTLDLMRERLATLPGLKVELTAANNAEQGINGRLRISGAGS